MGLINQVERSSILLPSQFVKCLMMLGNHFSEEIENFDSDSFYSKIVKQYKISYLKVDKSTRSTLNVISKEANPNFIKEHQKDKIGFCLFSVYSQYI